MPLPLIGGLSAGVAGLVADLGLDIWKQNKAEAQQNRQLDWQEHMSSTAYQRAVADMKAAGLNPMLAYSQGGASTPGGGTGTTPALHRQPTLSATLSAQQIAQSTAETERIRAETERVHAERNEIIARTETYPVNIDRMRQEITESTERIQKIHQDIKVGISSAAHLDQQVRNLQETIPQLRASTQQLQALANLNQAQAVERLTASGLNQAQAQHVLQQVRVNLPELQSRLMDLERIAIQMQQPGHMADETARSSFLGTMGAYLKALLPLGGVMGAIPIGRGIPATTIHKRR